MCVRITKLPELDVTALLSYFSDVTKHQVIGCYEEPHNNPHYHFWVKSKYKHDTLKRALNNIAGNRSFSVKSCEGKLLYLSKGPKAVSDIKKPNYPGIKLKPEIVVNTMSDITKQSIAHAHEEWWSIKYVKYKQDKAEPFIVQVEQWWKEENHFKEMQEYYQNRYNEIIGEEDFIFQSKHHDLVNDLAFQIATRLYKKFRIMKRLIDTPTIRKYVNHLLPDIVAGGEETLVHAWLRRTNGDLNTFFM